MAFGIRDAEIVREISRRGGFRAAAAALGLAPSAVSTRVTGLEARLGVALFDRAGRGARPTPTGRRFLEECERLIALRDRIAGEVMAEGTAPATLRIGVAETVVHTGLPGILRRLAERLPRLRTEVSTASSPELAAALEADGLDAALCLEGSATGAVLATLPPFAMGWFAAEPAIGAPWDAAALARRPIITFGKGTEPQRAVERMLSDPALAPAPDARERLALHHGASDPGRPRRGHPAPAPSWRPTSRRAGCRRSRRRPPRASRPCASCCARGPTCPGRSRTPSSGPWAAIISGERNLSDGVRLT